MNGDNTVTYTPASNYTGADSFMYNIADARGLTGSGMVNVTINAAQQGFSAWAAAEGLGPNADPKASPAHDGISNLIKYALGLNPNAVVSAVTNGTTPGLPWIQVQGGNLTMTFQKDLTKTDLTYAPQFTTDLVSPTTTGITQTVTATNGNIQTIVASVAVGSDTKKFMQLQITQH